MTLRADSKCRTASCSAPMLFAAVIKLDGTMTTLPVDPDPTPTGNLVYVRGSSHRPVLRTLDEDERLAPATDDRYVAHFVNCPGAESWRRTSSTAAAAGATTKRAARRRGRR